VIIDVQLERASVDSGFASMLCDLVRQNLESNPAKAEEAARMGGVVALVADDADVAASLEFRRGVVTVYDGIRAIPDVTIRGPSEALMSLSNLPSTTKLGLPIPMPGDRTGLEAVRTVLRALRRGELKVHGALGSPALFLGLSKVLSVQG
jgi:hypothetical protein